MFPLPLSLKGLLDFWQEKPFIMFVKTRGIPAWAGVAAGGIADIVLVVSGYGICEIVLYGFAAALGSMIPNLAQGIGGLVLALLLYPVLSAVPDFACMADRTSRRR